MEKSSSEDSSSDSEEEVPKKTPAEQTKWVTEYKNFTGEHSKWTNWFLAATCNVPGAKI